MPAAELGLKHFQKDEIKITRDDARKILVFFFGSNVPTPENLTDEDVPFAQALLLEAIDKSYAMGYVEAVFNSFYMKVPSDIKELMKDFAKEAAKNWFDHAAGKDLSNPKIYEMVRVTISNNYSQVWAIRMGGGDLTY
ncbi:MAG TPA: hypothetical protein VNZ03_33930 [Terriglobales bacterium]|jgi:hypothetical protein|nr:hypothetical protein [Terriglobales bacterium]